MGKTISTDELEKLLGSKEKYILIDVREDYEVEQYGKISTAVNISMNELGEAIELSEEEFKLKYGFEKFGKGDKIIVYCRTGSRSFVVAEWMTRQGFGNLFNYSGGVKEWSKVDKNVKMY